MKFDRTKLLSPVAESQLETILISPRMLIQFEVNLGGRNHCWEKRKPRRTTDCGFQSPGSVGKRD